MIDPEEFQYNKDHALGAALLVAILLISILVVVIVMLISQTPLIEQ